MPKTADPSAGIEVKNHSNGKVMIKYQEKYKALEFHVVVNGNPDTSLASLYRNPISLMFVTRASLPGTEKNVSFICCNVDSCIGSYLALFWPRYAALFWPWWADRLEDDPVKEPGPIEEPLGC